MAELSYFLKDGIISENEIFEEKFRITDMISGFQRSLLIVLGLGGIASLCSAPLEMTQEKNFDAGWKFARFGYMPDGSIQAEPGMPGEPIAASSTEKDRKAALAMDEDRDTRWCAAQAGAGQSLLLDMGEPAAVNKVNVVWEKEGVHQYKWEGSDDRNTWKVLYDGTKKEGKTEEDAAELKAKNRYYRLTITDADPSQWASVRELKFLDDEGRKVMPKPTPESALPKPSVPEFDDSGWRFLDLPHDWGVEGPFRMELKNNTGKLPWMGIGWYRKSLDVPADAKGNHFYLDFDGAMSCPQIFVNGQYAGEWKYGYASFRIDITPFLKFGEKNTIAVRLDNPADSSRWYPGGGIYRHVRLTESNPVHLENWGVFVRTPEVSKEKASVLVDSTVVNKGDKPIRPVVTEEILDGDKVVASTETQCEEIAPGQSGIVKSNLELKTPRLWDVTDPYLYTVKTTVRVDGKQIDSKTTNLGVRHVEWTADDGFHLNGRRVEIKGVCQHHDLGPLGGAVHKRGYERQIEILKEMGVNAIRTSHNPPAPEMLDACDRMGILVMDELFDCWESAKNPNDYHLYFKDWHERDLVNFVRRDRNHPSIVLWSGGNEVHEQWDPAKFPISETLTKLFHREDPSRKVGIGCSSHNSMDTGFADTVDVLGANYKAYQYNVYKEKRPNLPAFGSETSSCISSRGEYFFPVDWKQNKGFFNFQVSSYDLYAPGWAYKPDVEFKGLDENPRMAGEFVWTGFDYLGEPTPYNHDATNALNFSDPAEKEKALKMFEKLGKYAPSRSSYFGIVDLCGFKKDRFYLYQARWMPDKKMAHILPHWNWKGREGQVTPVHVYTSGDTAELFLNGQSQGKRVKGKEDDNAYRLVWHDVKYEPGELKVVVTKNGEPWATEIVETTTEETSFTVEADRPEIQGDGEDLSYLTISMKDAKGRFVPTAKTLLEFEISGPAEIVAVCNGDATDFTPFQGKKINAYNGLAQVIVRGKRNESGAVTLKTTANGMPQVETKLNVLPEKQK